MQTDQASFFYYSGYQPIMVYGTYSMDLAYFSTVAIIYMISFAFIVKTCVFFLLLKC